MFTEKIILPAWELVNAPHSPLKRFYFIPSLIISIYLGIIVLYQTAFTYIFIFGMSHAFFEKILNILHGASLVYIGIFVAVAIVVYILAIPISEAGLLSLIDRIKNPKSEGQHVYTYALARGIKRFLPIFELNNLLAPFKLLSVMTFYLFALRFLGFEYIKAISIAFGGYVIFSFLVNIFLSYARFFIVFEGKTPFEAIAASVDMTLESLADTFKLYFTMLLVYLRTILVTVLFVLFPFVASAALTYITTESIRIIGTGIMAILFLGILILITHINSVLEIFSQATWYNAYCEHKKLTGESSGGGGG